MYKSRSCPPRKKPVNLAQQHKTRPEQKQANAKLQREVPRASSTRYMKETGKRNLSTGNQMACCLEQATTLCSAAPHPLQWTSHSGFQPRRTTGCSVVPASSARAAAVRGRDGPTNMGSPFPSGLPPAAILPPALPAAYSRSACIMTRAAFRHAKQRLGQQRGKAGTCHSQGLTREMNLPCRTWDVYESAVSVRLMPPRGIAPLGRIGGGSGDCSGGSSCTVGDPPSCWP